MLGNTIKTSFESLQTPGTTKSLDGLRAIAILLVLIIHVSQHIPGLSFVCFYTEWATPLYNGWMGVDLFFVLSGFLITSMIISNINNNSFSIKEFYLQRCFRILPAYFCVLLLILQMRVMFYDHTSLFAPEASFSIKSIMMSFLLMTDLFPVTIGVPSWSLSIEEHFYLFLPCLFVFFRCTETRIKICILIIISALVLRMCIYRCFGISEAFPIALVQKFIYFPFYTRMDALAVGVLVALVNYQFPKIPACYRMILFYIGLLLCGFVYLTGAMQGGFYYVTIQYSLVCLGFGGVLWGALGEQIENKAQILLSKSFWVPAARLSYAVYLTHGLILNWIHPYIVNRWMFLPALLFCFLGALPLYLFVEHPLHQFGKKYIKNKRQNSAAKMALELSA